MCRCLERVCIGVLLLAAAGCTVDSFLNSINRQLVVNGPKVVVPGSVSEVAAKLRDGLGEAKMILNTRYVGASYRISSVTSSGTVFCLHLRPVRETGAIKTIVRIQWDHGGDNELWQLILKILNAPAEEGADTGNHP